MSTKLLPCFRISQRLDASPEAVFDAWVDPGLIRQWMFRSGRNEIVKAQNDLRVGGCFSILEWSGSEYIDHFGHFEEIEWPSRLAFTLLVPKHFPQRTHVSVMVRAADRGTELVLLQCGVHRRTVERAWSAMFDLLAGVLNDRRSRKARQLQASSTK